MDITKANKENFLENAIKNREELKEVYIEPFEYNARNEPYRSRI